MIVEDIREAFAVGIRLKDILPFPIKRHHNQGRKQQLRKQRYEERETHQQADVMRS